jgi:hypothetical protein
MPLPLRDVRKRYGQGSLAGWEPSRTDRCGAGGVRGVRYLEVDASNDSMPILRRLGFRAVTTTTPHVWTPPAAD